MVLALFPLIPRRRGVARRAGLHADHVTIWRWVQRYAPEMERRLRSKLKPTNDSWRMDETYIRVKGKWRYLYRAVDSTGATLDFLLSAEQDATVNEVKPPPVLFPVASSS
jgi:transposase-like protein